MVMLAQNKEVESIVEVPSGHLFRGRVGVSADLGMGMGVAPVPLACVGGSDDYCEGYEEYEAMF